MKIFKQTIGITLAMVALFAGFHPAEKEEQFMNESIFASMEKITISKLVDLEQIVVSVDKGVDESSLYQITAFEVDDQMTDEKLEKELKLRVGSNGRAGVMIFVAEKK